MQNKKRTVFLKGFLAGGALMRRSDCLSDASSTLRAVRTQNQLPDTGCPIFTLLWEGRSQALGSGPALLRQYLPAPHS